jgi:integrase
MTQEQLGHASPETTQIYAHLTDKTMAEAIDRIKQASEAANAN